MDEKQLEIFNKKLNNLLKPKFINWVMYLMVCSFFYNLAVVRYSVTGDNEFRLYDVLGIFIFYFYLSNYRLINTYIKLKPNINKLHQFLFWANITIVGTIGFGLYFGNLIWIIQTILYLYHFWTFFLFAIFLSIMLRDKVKYKRVIYLFLILVIAECVLVILQNLNIVPYLWSDSYKKTYLGFISGTMGPNKIVLGMTMLMSFIICVGLYFEKHIKVNRVIILTALILSLTTLSLTGSRTSYLGLGVFLVYFLLTKTVKFIYFGIVIGVVASVLVINNIEIVDVVVNVFEGRVVNKISDPTVFKDGDVDASQLYEDLGSGRKRLSLYYLNYLFSNPYIIPFGVGFNNRLILVSSAHNTYLSLINEVGIVGVVLYFRWIISYLMLNLTRTKYLRLALNGLILSMLVTLFFGEHLYVYRPLFALVGFFLFTTVILTTPRFYIKK